MNMFLNFYVLLCVNVTKLVCINLRLKQISYVLGMTLNCIHIFIVTGSFLIWCVMRPASQRFFIHSCIYLRILIISYLATFLGTNCLSVLMCRKAVNQSNKSAICRVITLFSAFCVELCVILSVYLMIGRVLNLNLCKYKCKLILTCKTSWMNLMHGEKMT